MSNQLHHILSKWFDNKDKYQWVLGTIYETVGPCYRKQGAMMLFNSVGQQFGLLSGGCLESDLQQKAKKVMQTGDDVNVTYDAQDEDNVSFQLGIGCGGVVKIILKNIHQHNHYLALDKIYTALQQRKAGLYFQSIADKSDKQNTYFRLLDEISTISAINIGLNENSSQLITQINPEPHLLVIGGGADALPVTTIAKQLGWLVSIVDPRPANARRDVFTEVDLFFPQDLAELNKLVLAKKVNAAIVMTHNLAMDACAIKQLYNSKLNYLALLGPISRKNKVLSLAKLTDEMFTVPLSSPAGLDIGATLPETIALSILAECQSVLANG